MIRICKYVLTIIAIILSSGFIFSFVAIREINNLGVGVVTKTVILSNATIIRSEDNNFNSSGKENENQQNVISNKVAADGRTDSSTKGRWIPLTNTERIQYNKREKRVCNNPFQHCCIGQGRQLVSKHSNIKQLYVKWSKPLSSLTSVLDFMSQQQIPCNIWFFGMSLSGDQMIGALCELIRDGGYTLDTERCIPYENKHWNESNVLKNCSLSAAVNEYPYHYYELTNVNSTSCPKVTLAHNSFNQLPPNHSSSYYYYQNNDNVGGASGGVMIMNHGVHCSKRNCVMSKLQDRLTLQFLNNAKNNGWKVLYRETERQHFTSTNGYYKWPHTGDKGCRPLGDNDDNRTEYDDYRNIEARQFLSDLQLQHNIVIPMIPIADGTRSLHYMHAYIGDTNTNKSDCTHYAFTPWRFHHTWDGLLKGLLTLK